MSECTIEEHEARTYAIAHRRGHYISVPEAIDQLRAWLSTHQLAPLGEPLIVYLSGSDGADSPPDRSWEVRIPIPARPDAPPDAAGVAIRRIPGELVATTTHRGSYEQAGEAYDRLLAWIAAHGAEVSGPPMESRLDDPIAAATPGGLTQIMVPIYERP